MTALCIERGPNTLEKGWSEYIIRRVDGGALNLPADEILIELFEKAALTSKVKGGTLKVLHREETNCTIAITAGLEAWVRSHFRMDLGEVIIRILRVLGRKGGPLYRLFLTLDGPFRPA